MLRRKLEWKKTKSPKTLRCANDSVTRSSSWPGQKRHGGRREWENGACRSQQNAVAFRARKITTQGNIKRNATARRHSWGAALQMQYFFQQLINGLTLGSIYGLIAIGYTMVFGIIGMVNFAHGDVFMIGAFVALIVFLILITAFIGSTGARIAADHAARHVLHRICNWAIERVAYRPLRGSFRLAPLISAIGMSIFLSNFVQVSQGPRNKSVPPIGVSRICSRVGTYQVTSRSSRSSSSSPPCCSPDSGGSCTRLRSAAPSAPASRTRRWRRFSASTSTGRSR